MDSDITFGNERVMICYLHMDPGISRVAAVFHQTQSVLCAAHAGQPRNEITVFNFIRF